METIHLINGTQKKIVQGHPWVYKTQIEHCSWSESAPRPGDTVEVCDSRGVYLGTGFYNPDSMIAVRLLTRRREPVNERMIIDRVVLAVNYRRMLEQPGTNCRRLIFAEADRLPGVIADQYGDTIVLQILSLGMEHYLEPIAEALLDNCQPANLLIQNEEPVRTKEGLPLYRRIYHGREPGPVDILENGLVLRVDLASGQKTGYFLDQKANHAALRPYAAGKNVLDCFTYIGGFALNAAVGGAASVTAVDISEQAIGLARTNASLNGLDSKMSFVTANAFDYLRQATQDKKTFDVVVLDPPAFAKSHAARAGAARGYKEINLSAFRLLRAGGILATHSCSFHMTEELFIETVLSAARDARRTVRIIEVRRQDRDHPVLAGYPESHYLKSLWLQVLEAN